MSEPFLQATSLVLLPQLVQFPAFSAESAAEVMKLLLLVCQRGNPKELLLALEQSLERLLLFRIYQDAEDCTEKLGLVAMILINGV